jgi:DNA-binding response OmpR family regulator
MKTILIVDDEKNIRKLYEKELNRDGYKVMVASSGEEALAAVDASPPDLIVLDIRMPQMDGIEMLNHLMAKHRNIPVILNSAYSSYKDDYFTWAADAYVIKSANLDELKMKIKEILEKS